MRKILIPVIASILILGAIVPVIAQPTFSFEFGSFGTGPGQFEIISDVTVDSLDNILVLDNDDLSNGKVQVFDSAGVLQSQFGAFVDEPQGITVDSTDRRIIVMTELNAIQVFDSAGVFQFQFGTFGSGPSQFSDSQGVAVDSTDRIIVTDAGNNRVQVFDSAGVFQFEFGTFGTGPGQFDSPESVHVDSADRIIVSDVENARVQVFQTIQTDPDTDDDGIFDEVDTQPSTFSNDFSDIGLGGTTLGTIITRGDQTLTISEEANPTGVKISADIGGGPTAATIDACSGASIITLNAGVEVVVTCTSVTIEVLSGSVDVEYTADDGTIITTILNEGDDVTFNESQSGQITNNGSEEIIISVNGGEPLSVGGGETVTIGEISHKEVICHKGKNTISISLNAVDAHLAHGDTLGSCP